jgi:hypothetical protein
MNETDDMFGTAPHKLSKRDDPETSHEAAHSIDSAAKERAVFNVVTNCHQDHGMICQEIADALGKQMHDTSPRISALVEKHMLYRHGDKRLGRLSNRKQMIVRIDRRSKVREK